MLLENLELNFDHMAERNPFMMVVVGDLQSFTKYLRQILVFM